MYIVADVGGTKTLVALIEKGGKLQHLLSFPSQKYPTFSHLLTEYLQQVKNPALLGACFAIAGPVVEGKSHLTNLPWDIQTSLLENAFKCSVALLNDLEAQAYSLEILAADSLFVLQKGVERLGNKAVISPGTGLGEAALFWDGKNYHPFATEGGHADFGPQNTLQLALASYWLEKFPHLSYERLLSGEGIHHIFQFLHHKNPGAIAPEILQAMQREDPAKVISHAALEKQDSLCNETLNLFMTLLGQESGNCALKFMSHGGVYVGGGVSAKLFPKFKEPFFLEGFLQKGRFHPLLQQIPVYVILDELAVLRGAAHFINR